MGIVYREIPVTYYVDFPTGSPVMSTWCNTLGEAKDLASRFADEAPTIIIHRPIFRMGNDGKFIPLI